MAFQDMDKGDRIKLLVAVVVLAAAGGLIAYNLWPEGSPPPPPAAAASPDQPANPDLKPGTKQGNRAVAPGYVPPSN